LRTELHYNDDHYIQNIRVVTITIATDKTSENKQYASVMLMPLLFFPNLSFTEPYLLS